MRIRGAHRHLRPDAAPDPVRVGGPPRWVVSAGVLLVVAGICAAGAYSLHDGGGSGSEASVLGSPTDGPTPWTVTTPNPDGPLVTGDPTDEGVPGDQDDDASPGGDVADGVPVSGAGGTGGTDLAKGLAAGEGVGAAAVTVPDPAEGVPASDRVAGIATRDLVQAGGGRLVVVPGHLAAPRNAPVKTVRVEVEEGIGADGPALAAFVMDTLNDNRGWSHDGSLTFARTDGPADVRVILASPATSARLCAPAQTRGTNSCGGNGRAVLTMFRWMNGIRDYADRNEYRRYLVNHEVGHVLGHSHAYCDPGHLAPVMVQQTLGLHGCLPNAWPFPRLG
jgi:hypothetical protein